MVLKVTTLINVSLNDILAPLKLPFESHVALHQTFRKCLKQKSRKNMFHSIHFSTSQNDLTADARKYPGIGVWFCQQHATLGGCSGVQYLCPPTGGVFFAAAPLPPFAVVLQAQEFKVKVGITTAKGTLGSSFKMGVS